MSEGINIYVGNLPYRATEDEISELFAEYGEVHTVNLITDRDTGRARGFGFVEMEKEGGNAAISALDGKDFQGRNLKINEARPREPRQSGGGGQRRRY